MNSLLLFFGFASAKRELFRLTPKQHDSPPNYLISRQFGQHFIFSAVSRQIIQLKVQICSLFWDVIKLIFDKLF